MLAGEHWHEGVVGIVASRIVERYQRPALLLSHPRRDRQGLRPEHSRLRSVRGTHRVSASLLTVYGGHAQAAGLTLAAAPGR